MSSSQEWRSKDTTAESFAGTGTPRPRIRLLDDDSGGVAFDANGLFRGNKAENYAFSSDYSFAQIGFDLAGQDRVVEPFTENVFVRAAVKAVANGVTRLKFGLWDSDPTLADAHEVTSRNGLLRLIQRPNTRQTENQFWSAHVAGLKISGESYWFIADSRGLPVPTTAAGVFGTTPRQIIQVSGHHTQIMTGSDGFPETYRYTIGGKTGPEFPAASVIPFVDHNPDDLTRGLGDAESAARQIDLQHQILRYLDASLRNAGAPSGMLIFSEMMAPEELERRQAEADDDYSVENAGRIKVVDRSAKFVPNTFTPKDFEYRDLWNGMTSAILTAMGVPEPVVGIYEKATFENVRTAFIEFWRGSNGVLALAGNTADVITHSLVPKLRKVWPNTRGMVANFDHSSIEVLADDFSDDMTLAKEIAKSGVGMSFNDALTMLGVKVGMDESGDRRLIAQGFTDTKDGKFFGPPPPPTPNAKAEKNAAKEAVKMALEELANE